MNIPDNLVYGFFEQFRFLSNFWPVKHGVLLDDVRYDTVEHAYQAAKTIRPAEREEIRNAPTAGKAKRFGSVVTMRDDWSDALKLSIMEDLLRQKFAPGTRLAEQLLETGDAKLIEGNTWGDTFWGRCRGKGTNHLGELLMKIREELKTAERQPNA